MGHDDFTFLNETGEKITVKHQHKDVTGETFSLEHRQSKKIQVDIPSQTYEKYWLYRSADENTGKYVSSDEYTSSKQVTVVKQENEFQLNFLPRPKKFEGLSFKAFFKKIQSFFTSKGQDSDTLPMTSRPSTSGGH